MPCDFLRMKFLLRIKNEGGKHERIPIHSKVGNYDEVGWTQNQILYRTRIPTLYGMLTSTLHGRIVILATFIFRSNPIYQTLHIKILLLVYVYLTADSVKRLQGWRWRRTWRSPPGQNSVNRHDHLGDSKLA